MEEQHDEDPESPYDNSELGLLLAQVGECDRAIELGERGKELLSIDKCHY